MHDLRLGNCFVPQSPTGLASSELLPSWAVYLAIKLQRGSHTNPCDSWKVKVLSIVPWYKVASDSHLVLSQAQICSLTRQITINSKSHDRDNTAALRVWCQRHALRVGKSKNSLKCATIYGTRDFVRTKGKRHYSRPLHGTGFREEPRCSEQ